MIRCCFIVGGMAGFPAKAPAALLACAAWAGALLGCSREPVVVPAASLTFPVVLITGGAAASNALPHRARVFANFDQLSHMRVELYSVTSSKTSAEAPKVIDANAQVQVDLQSKLVKVETGADRAHFEHLLQQAEA